MKIAHRISLLLTLLLLIAFSTSVFGAEETPNQAGEEKAITLTFEDMKPDPFRGFPEQASLMDSALLSSSNLSYEELKQEILSQMRLFPYYSDLRSVTLNFTGSRDEIDSWVKNVLNKAINYAVIDNPETLFFARNGYTELRTKTSDGVNWTVTFKPDVVENLTNVYRLTDFRSAVNMACAEAFGTTDPKNSGMTPLEIVSAAHDWIIANCQYDPVTVYDSKGTGKWVSPAGNTFYAEPDRIYMAYGVFVDRNAVCMGYALACGVLLDRAGIPNQFVDSDVIDHAWNVVNLSNLWYQLDCTWDDPTPDTAGRVGRTHLLKSDESFANHKSPDTWYMEYRRTCYYDYALPSALQNALPTPVFSLSGYYCIASWENGTVKFALYQNGRNFGQVHTSTSLPAEPWCGMYSNDLDAFFFNTADGVYQLDAGNGAVEKFSDYPSSGIYYGLKLLRYPTGEVVACIMNGYDYAVAYYAGDQQRYTVNFELNGGRGDTSYTTYYGQRVPFPVTTRFGYIFDGWYFDEDFQNRCPDYYNDYYLMYWGNTFYAKWNAAPVPQLEALSGGKAKCSITSVPSGTSLILSVYDASGRMIRARTCSANEIVNVSDGFRCRLFLLDSRTAVPVTNAASCTVRK